MKTILAVDDDMQGLHRLSEAPDSAGVRHLFFTASDGAQAKECYEPQCC